MKSSRFACVAVLVVTFVGSRASAGQVDPFSGSYQDSIPIEVPQFHGLEPQLALTYSSGRGNGFIGVGWSLAGLNTIERAGPNRGAPRYDATDIYLLDGQELVPCTVLGGTHCTKNQTHMRIKFDGINWQVWQKDGTKLTFTRAYGVTPGADAIWGTTDDLYWKWALSSVADTHGNTVTYNWNVNQFGCCWLYPDSIAYNTTSIKFYWESRPDLETRANGRGYETLRGRIKSIDVHANGSRTRTYSLTYSRGNSHYSIRSQLATVQQFARDASIDADGNVTAGPEGALPPMTLTYNGVGNLGSIQLGAEGNAANSQFIVGDFNGDGKNDLFKPRNTAGGGTGTVYLFQGTSDAQFAAVNLGSPGGWNTDDNKYYAGDFNGDGKTDLLKFENTAWGGDGYTLLSNGDGTFTWVSLGCPGAWNTDYAKFYVGDFNGDGKDDFLRVGNSAWNGDGYTLLSNGDGTFTWVNLGSPGAWNTDYVQFHVGDFNGDGKADVLRLANTAWGGNGYTLISNGDGTFTWVNSGGGGAWNTDYAKSSVGDFNGDGKSDLLRFTNTAWGGDGYALLSNGDGTFTWVGLGFPEAWTTWSTDDSQFILGDFNGDGKTDFEKRLTANGYVVRYLSSGDGTFFDGIPTTPGSYTVNLAVADFNGDGSSDILYALTNTMSYLAFSASNMDLLVGIGNGVGGGTSVVYTPSTAWPNANNLSVVPTVSSITVGDGRPQADGGTQRTDTWTFSGGYHHSRQREFRGFATATATGQAGPNGEQLQQRYWFHQGDDVAVDVNDPSAIAGYMKGRPFRKQVWDLQKSTYTETVTSYWSAAGPPYFAPPYEVATRACQVVSSDGSVNCGANLLTTYAKFVNGAPVFPYDEYGNLLQENQYGDITDPKDDRQIGRFYSAKALTPYIVGLKTSEVVSSLTPPLILALTTYHYDGGTAADCSSTGSGWATQPTRGDLTNVVQWLDGGASPQTWIGYDAFGNVACVSDPDRRVTKYSYDVSGNFRVATTNAKSHVTTTQFYGVDGIVADKGLYGQPKKVIDPNLSEVSFEYDGFGRMTKKVLPPVLHPLAGPAFPGLTTTASYYLQTGNSRVETTSSDGAWAAMYLDGLGRTFLTKRKASPTGRVIAVQRQFNSSGTTLRTSFPYEDLSASPLRWTSFEYDGRGRVTKTVAPDGTSARACYDDLGLTSVRIDANNHRVRETSDARGNRIALRDYRGTYPSCTTEVGTPYSATQYEYDVMGRLRSVIDAHGARVETDYDTLGRPLFRSDPDRGTWYYDSYSAAGDLQSQRDANGNTISFRYDELHRMDRKTYPDATTVSYVYDDPSVAYSKGRLTSMVDTSGVTAYQYDAVGRDWKRGRTIDGVWYTVEIDYDGASRMSGLVYPDGSSVSYAYDADGFLWKVDGASVAHATLTGYNVLGQVGTLQFGNGVTTQYHYNDTTNNKLNGINTWTDQGTWLMQLEYSAYDSAGNVKTIRDALDGTRTQSLVYDELNRLTSASSQAYGTIGYSYDEIGNLAAKEGIAYTYNPIRVHQVTATSDGRAYGYDLNGNMLSDGTRQFMYDYDNRPVSIDSGGTRTLFAYDGSGNRVKKQAASGTTVYVGGLYECTAGACTRHVFAGDNRIASIGNDGKSRYYHTDHLDSTRVVTSQAAAGQPVSISESVYYTPFGATQSDSAPAVADHKYTSQELDAETGLYFYKARYYNPALGKFVSPDPSALRLDNPQDLNPYSYTLNNPVRYTDPTGLSVWSAVGDFLSDLGNQITNQGVFVYAGNGGLGVGVGSSQPYYPFGDEASSTYYVCAGPCESSPIRIGPGLVLSDGDSFTGWSVSGSPTAAGAITSSSPRPAARPDIELFYGLTESRLMVLSRGELTMQMNATSGRGDCMNNTACVRDVKRGPILPGSYRIDTSEIQAFSLATAFYHSHLQRVGGGDWGSFRVTLHPEFNTGTRNGFFLHGGSIPGSAGCVDVGGGLCGNAQTARLITLLGSDSDGVVPFTVYESLSVPISLVLP